MQGNTDSTIGKLTMDENGGNNWNVKYDPTIATLTLKGATIDGDDYNSNIPFGAGIYAEGNPNSTVALMIVLEGSSNVFRCFWYFCSAKSKFW